MKTEHPILFSTPTVKAILEGSKSMTRRIMKVQPKDCSEFHKQGDDSCSWSNEPMTLINDLGCNRPNEWYCKYCGNGVMPDGHSVFKCPFGKVGDILWVKETYYDYGKWIKNGLTKTGKQKYKFKSTLFDFGGTYHYADYPPDKIEKGKSNVEGWYKRPSLFMPRSAARIFLEITDIRIERLNQITTYDALCEGIYKEFDDTHYWYMNYLKPDEMIKKDPIRSFQTLWQSINGIDSWELNPFVWVIEFKRIEQ